MNKKKIAFFSTGWVSEILTLYVNGIREAFKDDSVDLFLYLNYNNSTLSREDTTGEQNIFRLPKLRDFDAAVVFANAIDQPEVREDIINRCREANIPVISHGVVERREGVYSVVSDNTVGMYELGEHLIKEHGVRDIVFFSGAKGNEDAEARLSVIRELSSKYGVVFSEDNIVYTEWEPDTAYKHAIKLYNIKQLPDAFICANDEIAMSICLAMRECGVKVPEEIMVTGFDHIDQAQIFYPSITTVDQDFKEHGRETARILKAVFEGREAKAVSSIPCSFVKGESCGCDDEKMRSETRKLIGTDAFAKWVYRSVNRRHFKSIEMAILSSGNYNEIREKLVDLLSMEHDFEGDTYFLLIDPKCIQSISNSNIIMKRNGYSEKLDIIAGMNEGRIYNQKVYDTKEICPAYTEDEENHIYVFLPLHDKQYSVGLMVFRDCMDKVESRELQTYCERINVSIEKFRQNQHLQYMNTRLTEYAQIDSLTHVKNHLAYDNKAKEIDKQTRILKNAEYGIVMFDINDLKKINDELGHDIGDEYILNSCKEICNAYKHSPVYRIGGDEFVAVIQGEDYENREEILEKFRQKMKEIKEKDDLPPEEKVSVASGISIYDPDAEESFKDVFRRADGYMYINKSEMKKGVFR